jgi:hypothetical protein
MDAACAPLMLAFSRSDWPRDTRISLKNLLADYCETRCAQKEIQRLRREHVALGIEDLAVSRFKRSDTVFILGSGASVNDLNAADWSLVARHDSVGFNFWLIHDFVPRFFFLEMPADPHEAQLMREILATKAAAYRDVPCIMDYRVLRKYHPDADFLGGVPEPLRSNVYLRAWYYVPALSRNWAKRTLRLWQHLYARGHVALTDALHYRSSLCAVVLFSFMCGYKNLVLVGVDLNDSLYFWQTRPKQYPHLPLPDRSQARACHVTIDPQHSSLLPIDEFLYLLDEVVLGPAGVQLYVAGTRSRLFPHFPQYPGFVRPEDAAVRAVA